MSGCTGADRITKEKVQLVTTNYITNILSKYPHYKGKYKITGSYNVGKKQTYGDIDMVVLMDNTMPKNEMKKDFTKWLVKNYDEKTIQRFTSIKHTGKRFYNAGELVSIKYPQNKTTSVQIDNIFSMDENEFNFKTNFLNLPAEIQGLYLGIIKTIMLEVNPKRILNDLCINIELDNKFEYEFNLSGQALQLRKVKLENYKTISSEIVWESSNWEDVEYLLKLRNCNTQDFYILLQNIKNNFYNRRSKHRIKGLFKSMISVKSGEINTEKGYHKEMCLSRVSNL